MVISLTPITIPGVSIRPPDSAPGSRNMPKRKKPKPSGIKPVKKKRPARKTPR